jgi:hypothetical protein
LIAKVISANLPEFSRNRGGGAGAHQPLCRRLGNVVNIARPNFDFIDAVGHGRVDADQQMQRYRGYVRAGELQPDRRARVPDPADARKHET